MTVTERAIVLLSPIVGSAWVASRRRRYRKLGRPLNGTERLAFGGYFDPLLLQRVRIAIVPRIDDPPGANLLRSLGFGTIASLSSVRGMAFGDAIVVTGSPDRTPPISLLFHELVHVVQYEQLGIGPMLRRYVAEYFESGRDYFAIIAERCAYALQERFEREQSARFSVVDEVERWMTTKHSA